MKIAVVGPGALGCLLAAYLFEAGEEVHLVDYRPERVRLLGHRGIHLEALNGRHSVVPVPVGLPEEVGPADLVLITVKTYHTAIAAQALPGLLAPGGIALTLQNGLGNLEELARVAGWEPLAAGVTFLGVIRREEGVIVHAGEGATHLGIPARSRVTRSTLESVAEIFRRAGLECLVQDDIETMLWEKLLVNVGLNATTATIRVTNGVMPELPVWSLCVAAAAETIAVARAAGITITADPDTRLRQVCRATAANRSSMLQDTLAGRPTEILALNGQVAARGAALGVPTPVNDFITKIILSLEKSASQRVG